MKSTRPAVYHGHNSVGNHYADQPCPVESSTLGREARYRCPGSGLIHESRIRTEVRSVRMRDEAIPWGRDRLGPLTDMIDAETAGLRAEHDACYAGADEPVSVRTRRVRSAGPGSPYVARAGIRVRGCHHYVAAVRAAIESRGLRHTGL